MPRFRTRPDPPATSAEFDLCSRCAQNGDVRRSVLREKLALRFEEGSDPFLERVAHRSYDFQPRPIPCISCARILTSEDD